jgi:hypothetical protein
VAKLKKMMNGAEKAGKRPSAVARTEARKILNRAGQDQRARDNRYRRENGEATPWEIAKAKRAARPGRQGVQLAS